MRGDFSDPIVTRWFQVDIGIKAASDGAVDERAAQAAIAVSLTLQQLNLSPNQLFEEFFEERLGRPLSPLQRSTFQRVLESCMEDGDAK